MKSSLAFCLSVLAITASYPIGDRQGDDLYMLNDDGMGQKNGSSVNITGTGLVNVVLEANGFGIGFCSKKCDGEVLVCYEGDKPSLSASDLCDSGCGFFIATKNNTISVTPSSISEYKGKQKKDACETLTIEDGIILFGEDPVTSCVPKIDNGMVKLNVTKASSDCPILIKNAFVLPESTSAPPTTSTPESANFGKTSTTKSGASGANNGTSVEDSPTFMSSYWWIFLIIGLILVVGIVIGVLLYCFVFKKEKKPTTVQPGQAASRTLARPKTKIVAPPAEEEENKRPKLPSSIIDPSSILSRKSLLDINREEPPPQLDTKKEEAPQSTDLKSINVAA